MDGVTTALSSLQLPWFTWASVVIDRYFYLLLFLLAFALYIVYPSVRKNKLKLWAFALALLLVCSAVIALKTAYSAPRICVSDKLGYCPSDYSFPSGHTAFAFTFAGASLGTTLFPLFFLIAIITAISRMYLGVHSLNDVIAGAGLALGIYFFVQDALLHYYRKRFRKWAPPKQKPADVHFGLGKLVGWSNKHSFEFRRQVSHITYGTIIIALIYFLGTAKAEILLLCALFLGMTAMHLRMEKKRAPVVDYLFDLLERPMVMPAKGAFMYTVGAMLALSFLGNLDYALAVLAVVAWGDGMATVFGRHGKAKLPYNKKKTVLGTIAFAAFGFAAASLFIGWAALPLAILAALVESLETKMDDNFVIPVACIAFLTVFG